MMDERLAASEWAERCAHRIVVLDPAIGPSEARRIALDMRGVERLAAMPPEAAVDFVQTRLASDRPERYERRLTTR